MNENRTTTVIELPAGKYDAVRTLRHLLAKAENGEIMDVICIAMERDDENGDTQTLVASWSDMKRMEVLWAARWFNSWLNNRYFAMYHNDVVDDDD